KDKRAAGTRGTCHTESVFEISQNEHAKGQVASSAGPGHGRPRTAASSPRATGECMSEQDKAGQARKGLIDTVKGKAKEIAGAVTGRDSLTAEGQLEQVQAKERKEANAVEGVADAEAQAARSQEAQAHQQGAAARSTVNSTAAAAEQAVTA